MLAAIVLPAAVVIAIFVGPYVRDPGRLPVGHDTPGYVWRSALVHDRGVMALRDLPFGFGERPAHPVITATLLGLSDEEPLVLAWVFPAMLAAVIALVTGGLVTAGLAEPRRRALAYGVGVGASGFVAWTAVGYAANLTLDPVAIAAVLAAMLAGFAGRGILAGSLLLLGAALIHWMFAMVICGLLASWALTLIAGTTLPERYRPPRGAARRVLTLLGGGVLAGTAALAVSPAFPADVLLVDPGTSTDPKATRRLPGLALWVTLPAALVGAVLGVLRGTSQRRWGIGVLILWSLLAPVSIVGWYLLDLPLPPYRWAAFALAVPILVVLGAACIGDLIRRRVEGVGGRLIAVAILVVASGGLAVVGARVWSSAEPRLEAVELVQLEIAARYLDAAAADRPVVILTRLDPRPIFLHLIQAGLPPDVFTRLSLIPARTITENDAAEVPDDAVVLFLPEFAPGQPPPGEPLGQGVVLVRGPAPSAPVPTPPPGPRAPSGPRLVALVLAGLLVLMASGSGWAGLLDLDPIARTSVAPAFGLALVGTIGVLTSRAGLPFDRTGGLVLVGLTTALGWAVDLASRRARASRSDTAPGAGVETATEVG